MCPDVQAYNRIMKGNFMTLFTPKEVNSFSEDAAGVDKTESLFFFLDILSRTEAVIFSDTLGIHLHSSDSTFTLLKNLLHALGFT